MPGVKAELEALRQRHTAALELMGERDEEVQFLLCNYDWNKLFGNELGFSFFKSKHFD